MYWCIEQSDPLERRFNLINYILYFDEKISQFNSISDKATIRKAVDRELHDEEYQEVYYGAEHLLTELFSEKDAMKFRKSVTSPIGVVGLPPGKVLKNFLRHIRSCVAQLKVYKERIETFWPDDEIETEKRIRKNQKTLQKTNKMPEYFEYDIAISFAGEDRDIAEDLAKALHNKGVRVFYDRFYKDKLWGKELTKYLGDVYGPKTRFVVILISKYYPVKDWTDFEFSIIREEAKKRKTEFILPVRLNNTKIMGIHEDLVYLDYRKEGIDGIVDCCLKKLPEFPERDRKDRIGNIVDRYSPDLLRFLVRKKGWTTFAELHKELGLSMGIIKLLVNALEAKGYVTVSRGSLNKMLIIVDDKPSFGKHIAEEIKKCLQNLAADAREYIIIGEIVENLPEEAIAHFKNGDLWSATKTYNVAAEKLMKAGIKTFPLIEWRKVAEKISLDPKFDPQTQI